MAHNPGKLPDRPALLVELLASPLLNRPVGIRWLSTPDLVGEQIDLALRVRRGLRCQITPVAVGAEAERAALEDAANFGAFIEQLRSDYAGRPFVCAPYAHAGDPRGRNGALRDARMSQAILGGELVEDGTVPCYGIVLPGEGDPEVVFLYGADPTAGGGLQ